VETHITSLCTHADEIAITNREEVGQLEVESVRSGFLDTAQRRILLRFPKRTHKCPVREIGGFSFVKRHTRTDFADSRTKYGIEVRLGRVEDFVQLWPRDEIWIAPASDVPISRWLTDNWVILVIFPCFPAISGVREGLAFCSTSVGRVPCCWKAGGAGIEE
jgi:hypothetical protein